MSDDAFHIDKRQMRAAFDDAARTYDQVAVLQREVGQRLFERLDYINLAPRIVVDVGAGTGTLCAQLAKRYKAARVIALDIAPGMLRAARKHKGWFAKQHFVCGDAEQLPFADGSVDLLFSNLVLQWCNTPDRFFSECARVLTPTGLAMFSTLGPDTLRELRESWRAADANNHVNAFVDMHDVGDALLRAGLSDPVMDVERLTVTFPTVTKLMRDLKALGAHNVTHGRARGLTGKGRLQSMTAAYERYRRGGVLPASYEIVYGHAWGRDATKQHARTSGEAAIISLERLHRREPKP